MNRLLLLEDDINLASNVREFLKSESYHVDHCLRIGDLPSSLNGVDLIIMDWMLPDGNGLDLLKKLRREGVQVPVLFLTAKVDLIDKVLGLESGASDYMTKPFELRELLARIRVQLREKVEAKDKGAECRISEFIINSDFRQVERGGRKIEMTRKEFDLFYLLVTNSNKVYSREELLNKIWGFENFPTTRTVDNHILQLRQKCGDQWFETVRGIGYRFLSQPTIN